AGSARATAQTITALYPLPLAPSPRRRGGEKPPLPPLRFGEGARGGVLGALALSSSADSAFFKRSSSPRSVDGPMRTQLRIVAGMLRGRKLTCNVNPNLRPTPQMVREALFSLLGNA